MEFTIYIILVPMLLFFVLALGGRWLGPRTAGIIGTAGMGAAALLSYIAVYKYFFAGAGIGPDGNYLTVTGFNAQWLRLTDSLHIDMGVLLDPISVMMLAVVTTVSLMVHIYSFGYMKGERGFQRYYAFLSLFSFSMLGLVVATNIFQMYIFWELVGASSYLLIGFYYTRPAAVAASKKAFIVTRFADFGFLIGILILSYCTKTFDFGAITADNASLAVRTMEGSSFLGLSSATWAMLLIFMGGAGKSAMFPLHIWLPDAMEGPTPVSALIHAATMVVAGVYLVARMFPVYLFAAPQVLTVIGYVGAFTALFAAIIAMVQTDIKRVLAFSTISQIAYMMVALGVSGMGGHAGEGYTASMFHLFTHAFFKALLFLGAGAVIHAVHSNEMEHMGGLRKRMPVTHITFLVACLAIAGIPPLSGFFSKDEILSAAMEGDKVLFAVLWIVAGITAFYMFRLYFRIFWGRESETARHAHEAPAVMLVPLAVLALLTCVTGFIPFSRFISPDNAPYALGINWGVAGASIAIGIAGIALAAWLYMRDSERPQRIAARMGGFYKAAKRRLYIDDAWAFLTKNIIFRRICAPIAWFDRHVIDGTWCGIANVTQRTSEAIKGIQNGRVQAYALLFIISVLLITIITLFI